MIERSRIATKWSCGEIVFSQKMFPRSRIGFEPLERSFLIVNFICIGTVGVPSIVLTEHIMQAETNHMVPATCVMSHATHSAIG